MANDKDHLLGVIETTLGTLVIEVQELKTEQKAQSKRIYIMIGILFAVAAASGNGAEIIAVIRLLFPAAAVVPVP